jgi:NtrC-family two-component system response regulator AlgB
LITVDCRHQSPEQLQRDLFGDAHRSSLTGDSAGWLAAAEGGAVLLDNVGALPMTLQASLLHLIRDRQYQRIGDRRHVTANLRIISTGHASLARAVAAGSFREDLYQALHAFAINLPPLRDRLADLEIIAQLQLKLIGFRSGKVMTGLSQKAIEALAKHRWPGNFRELYYVLECAVMRTSHTYIDAVDLPEVIQYAHAGRTGIQMSLEEVEIEHIRRVIAQSPSLEKAARILGINPATLFRKRKRLLAEEQSH